MYKTENTLKNKAKFFAQYWGQRVFTIKEWNSVPIKDVSAANILYYLTTNNTCILVLKPLSKISDEDEIELAEITGLHKVNYLVNAIHFGEKYIIDTNTNQQVIDFLRSKGYALPWMDLSVEDLIEYGWIKLIE